MIHNLLALIIEINNGTDYNGFFDYNGYTKTLLISVNKKERFTDPLYYTIIFLDRDNNLVEVEKQLKNFLPLNIETYDKNS